jgi:hypothetical protein
MKDADRYLLLKVTILDTNTRGRRHRLEIQLREYILELITSSYVQET